MTSTSLLSLLMSNNSVGPPDPPDSSDRVGDQRLLPNVESLASIGDSSNDCYDSNCCLLTHISQTTARQEPPPHSYSPDAYDTEIYGSASSTRILDEPPLDAHSNDTSPVATPTTRNTRTTHQPLQDSLFAGLSLSHRTVISPVNLACSPLTSSSAAVLEREYDRDTWRLFHRIQLARSLQQQQHPSTEEQQQQELARLKITKHSVSSDSLVEEEFEDDYCGRMTVDEVDEQIMFDMD